jgi:hypothetical protein
MILAAIVIAKNLSQYGLDFAPQAPLGYENVTVENPIDLRRVAEWTGAPIDDIQALNLAPALDHPVRMPTYDLKVPVGTGDACASR